MALFDPAEEPRFVLREIVLAGPNFEEPLVVLAFFDREMGRMWRLDEGAPRRQDDGPQIREVSPSDEATLSLEYRGQVLDLPLPGTERRASTARVEVFPLSEAVELRDPESEINEEAYARLLWSVRTRAAERATAPETKRD